MVLLFRAIGALFVSALSLCLFTTAAQAAPVPLKKAGSSELTLTHTQLKIAKRYGVHIREENPRQARRILSFPIYRGSFDFADGSGLLVAKRAISLQKSGRSKVSLITPQVKLDGKGGGEISYLVKYKNVVKGRITVFKLVKTQDYVKERVGSRYYVRDIRVVPYNSEYADYMNDLIGAKVFKAGRTVGLTTQKLTIPANASLGEASLVSSLSKTLTPYNVTSADKKTTIIEPTAADRGSWYTGISNPTDNPLRSGGKTNIIGGFSLTNPYVLNPLPKAVTGISVILTGATSTASSPAISSGVTGAIDGKTVNFLNVDTSRMKKTINDENNIVLSNIRLSVSVDGAAVFNPTNDPRGLRDGDFFGILTLTVAQ